MSAQITRMSVEATYSTLFYTANTITPHILATTSSDFEVNVKLLALFGNEITVGLWQTTFNRKWNKCLNG